MMVSRFIILVTIFFLSVTWRAEASWRVDPERFHIGVHGRLSCQDCHADVATRPVHPNPADVNRKSADFFTPQVCAACHESALEEVAEGRHGGMERSADRRVEACIACHDPHYQSSASVKAVPPDLGQPSAVKCRLCHEFQAALPRPGLPDEACFACHHRPGAADPGEVEKTAAFCLSCHGADTAKKDARGQTLYPMLDRAQYAATPHARLSCLTCHPDADDFGHGDQRLGDCRRCHAPHDARTANEVHLKVACGACHLNGVTPVKHRVSGGISWTKTRSSGISDVHRMSVPDRDQNCRQCHFSRNGLGAAAAVLPPKSILCMPCHAATLSAGDAVTLPALIVFGFGVLVAASVWASGRPGLRERKASHLSFAVILGEALKGFILDGLLQRRLFLFSKSRWVVHGLVFFPFVFRFVWGVAAQMGSRVWPGQSWSWVLLDQNNPVTAFVFDLSGLLVLVGVGAMVYRRLTSEKSRKSTGLPPADWPAHSLLGAIMIAGFALEGLRIAMTGYPPGSAYAFVGDALSRLFYGATGLEDLYGYIWYGHAVLTGLFVAYLPFSRMFHIILAPVFLALRPFSIH
jgi:nitrate reductase gamma subunit